MSRGVGESIILRRQEVNKCKSSGTGEGVDTNCANFTRITTHLLQLQWLLGYGMDLAPQKI
jgi:hypothetical protein